MVLLSGLGLSIYYEELPVPERLISVINDRFKSQGLNLEFENITLNFSGNVLIREARVAFTQQNEHALEVESLYLDINYASIVLKKAPFDLIRLGNAQLYSPAVVSQSGTNESLVNTVNFELIRQWRRWKLNYFTAKIQDLDISASGDLSVLIAELIKPREKKEDRPELYLQYLHLARTLSDYSKHLKWVESPMTDLRFSSPSNSNFVVNIHAQADSFSYNGFPNTHHLRSQSTIQILPDLRLKEPLKVKVGLLEDEGTMARVSNVALSAWSDKKIKSLESLFPFDAELTTGVIEVQGNEVEQLVFKGQILNQDSAKGQLITSLFGAALQADLSGNWKDQTVEGSIRGSVNIAGIIERPEFDHLWKLRWSKQNKPLYLDVDFNYPGNLPGLTANIRAETRDIDIIKTPFKWARARGTLQGTKLDVPQLEGGGYGNDLQCTFVKDLNNPFYRFTVAGRFRPHDLDVWWRDWWKKTFDYLEIKGVLPWMDLSMRNAFTYKKQLTLFGYVEAENINLKGMHFDQASSRLYIRPNYIDATDLKLVRQEGEAKGQFQRHLEMSQLKNVIVDISSSLELEPSLGLFGESGLRIIAPYTWTGNPTISLQGEFNFENNTHWQDLEFTIDTDESMTLYNFPFDSLHVKGNYDRGDTLLHDVDFGFASGQGRGEASFLRQDDQAYFLFDFDVEDAELAEALKRIALVKALNNDESEEEPPTKKKTEPLEGKLTIHASGVSPAGFGLDRVMAKGDIEIKDGNLARIPLFGPLSSLIPFTKLHLNNAKSYFAWDNGKMTFPDLVMTSKTARLEGLGDFYTSNSDLDFQVRVFLLREADIPLISNIIMPIFDPFSQMAAVNLKGTLKKPEWRFAISPFNLFDAAPGKTGTEPVEKLLDFEFRK
jgi:hypothetical protein